MPDLDPTILLTRPRAQSLRFAKGLAGLNLVISPILEIRFRKPELDPRDFDALVFTSENAVRAAASFWDLSGLKGYAVGQRTADVGAEFGVALSSANGNADDLVRLIRRDRPKGRLLHLHGLHSRGHICDSLIEFGLDTDSAVCYDQDECALTNEATDLLAREGVVLLPLFSPRSAALLGKMCQGSKAQLVLIGISAAALDGWSGPAPSLRLLAAAPTAKAMRQEILRQTGRSA